MKRFAMLFLALTATPAFAQMARPEAAPSPDPAVTGARDMWNAMSGYIAKAAEQMAEADYSFRPVATVRTFGQLIGHVAGAQNMICSAALGEAQKGEDDIEKNVTTKAGLVAAIKASNAYCARAYAQTDAAAGAGMTKLFGQDRTRMYALIMNATHDSEHYGNIVTYLRVKGMVPPSSQPAPAGM
ncbi:MAG: DinB family protein [Gemmatimonadales bacterium]